MSAGKSCVIPTVIENDRSPPPAPPLDEGALRHGAPAGDRVRRHLPLGSTGIKREGEGEGAPASMAGIAIPRPHTLATRERISPPKPRRDQDARRETAGPAAHGTGFRPPGCRDPSPHRRPEGSVPARVVGGRAARATPEAPRASSHNTGWDTAEIGGGGGGIRTHGGQDPRRFSRPVHSTALPRLRRPRLAALPCLGKRWRLALHSLCPVPRSPACASPPCLPFCLPFA